MLHATAARNCSETSAHGGALTPTNDGSSAVPARFAGVLTPRQVQQARAAFDEFDADGSGSVDAQELAALVSATGHPLSPHDIQRLLQVRALKLSGASVDGRVLA